MKFGHTFKEALAAETYPPHWVEKAITYRNLKKILHTVREELIAKGYDPDTLHRLLSDRNAEYRLEEDASRLLRPRLVVRPEPCSLTLPPEAWEKLRLAADLEGPQPDNCETTTAELPQDTVTSADASPVYDGEQPASPEAFQWVKIPLDSDSRFFKVLQSDVVELDALQTQERKSMNVDICTLGDEMSIVARPRKAFINLSKSDLYRWRDIFELYLDAEIFFSTNETTGGVRNSKTAQQQLVWFQNEVTKRDLLPKFKLEASAIAYARFLELNATLLQNVQFQELNQTAVVKIIKKFDKQTSLGVRTAYPAAFRSANFLAESIAKNICAQLASDVLKQIPRVADYSCSICLCLVWLPVRLDCKHLFCIRCMIKMQNQKQGHCPLCRANTVLGATEDNIDSEVMHYLEKWFPREVKEKEAANELERRRALFGPNIPDEAPKCIVM